MDQEGRYKIKKLLAIFLCAFALCVPAAETDLTAYSIANGQVAAVEFVDIVAPYSGVLEPFDLEAGDAVAEGDGLFGLVTAKLTAPEEGRVTWIFGQAGERAEDVCARYGAVVSMEPAQDQRIMASSAAAYNDEENRTLHVGEIVYFQSAKGDKEEGAGRVISVSGENFVVDILTGVFETGETLTLYRDDDYDNKEKVGKGAVVRRDPVSLAGGGVIAEVLVEEGESVQAGQVVATLAGYDADVGASPLVTAPAAGVAAMVPVSSGQQVWKGQLLARIFCTDEMEIVVQADEVYLKNIEVGDELPVTLDTDDETVLTGTVTEISALGMTVQNAAYFTVHLSVDGADDLMLGQSAKVYLPK